MDGEPRELIIRTLNREDLQRLVRMDEQIVGRSRTEWFRTKLDRAMNESDVCISLGAEKDGLLVGAVSGSMQYGEFGLPEPVAVLDTVLVDPKFSRQGIASALLDQLLKNLRAIRVSHLRTEVSWDEVDLISFFRQNGFKPAPRLVLEVDLTDED
jgi:ribosomal protein S18 acetylase RimI-like enzyme